jgi:Ca2+-transporting ATPase
MPTTNFNIKGLTDQQVLDSRAKHGHNELNHKKENEFLIALRDIFKEPMFILLLVTSIIYFISGKIGDGIFMASAIVLVAVISLYQESRSRNAIESLKKLTHPNSKVIRNSIVAEIKSEEIVIDDCIMIEEGCSVPADGIIIQSNDFSVNESMLTGESMAISKNDTEDNNQVFAGTTVTGGLALCKVVAIGSNTKLGQIGKSMESVREEDTPLQIQINHFIKMMAIAGVIVFLIVWVINFLHSTNVLDSLLKALTLAMSILPEEIPVAFTTFMALGVWRLMKKGIIVKQTKIVETLGSASVICTDKTGTITENKMELAKLFVLSSQKTSVLTDLLDDDGEDLIRLAMWSSEPIPFDPMEVALHDAYKKLKYIDERPGFKLIHEYPLDGKPPMMTHVFENASGNRITAAKGAPEALMNVSCLTNEDKKKVTDSVNDMAAEGYRVLAVGVSDFQGNDFPEKQQSLKFKFKGLVAFYDPPKENINLVFESFYKAGIALKIITGDNAATTTTIAKMVGFKGAEKSINGEDLMRMSEDELKEKIMDTNIFTRMFPEAKLKIINVLKAHGQIVAMIGDGVNDGPALKAAHIGIAMGVRGSEIAKQASSLILIDDDLAKMLDAVAMGRRIYTNLKKAIQYIISIHIPIILTVFLPLALGWIYPNIFSPVHIIFLELIMGPTCSIIYENEPMEKNAMLQNPRPFVTTFFNGKELTTSILQGLVITFGTLICYQYAVQHGYNEAITRTMVFTVLIAANIFLTLVNRSFYYSILTTSRYKNPLVSIIIAITIVLLALLLFVPLLTKFFLFERLNGLQLAISIGIGFLSAIWFEAVKLVKRRQVRL